MSTQAVAAKAPLVVRTVNWFIAAWSAIATGWLGKAIGLVVMVPFAITTAFLATLLDIVRGLSRRVGDMPRTLVTLAALTVGAFSFFYLYAVELSAFAAAPLKAVLGCSILFILDHFGLQGIDTIAELRAGNEAVARHYQSYALIIAAALLSL